MRNCLAPTATVFLLACSGDSAVIGPDAKTQVDAAQDPQNGNDACDCRPLQEIDLLAVGQTPVTGTLDISGDGQVDNISYANEAGHFILRLTMPDAQIAEVDIGESSRNFWAIVRSAQVAGDAKPELIVSLPWENAVLVFDVKPGVKQTAEQAVAKYSEPRDVDNAAPFFGKGVAVADINQDGVKDLLIGAPGEREEACSAAESLRVYFGPVMGVHDGGASDLMIEPSPNTPCWGEAIAHCKTGLLINHWIGNGGVPMVTELQINSQTQIERSEKSCTDAPL